MVQEVSTLISKLSVSHENHGKYQLPANLRGAGTCDTGYTRPG